MNGNLPPPTAFYAMDLMQSEPLNPSFSVIIIPSPYSWRELEIVQTAFIHFTD